MEVRGRTPDSHVPNFFPGNEGYVPMIKRFIDSFFGRRGGSRVTHKDAKPVIYGKDQHAIERDAISRCARRTCEELQRAGYLAFVVGGAVRDLLLGQRPKDF